jgi:hypothetical protein
MLSQRLNVNIFTCKIHAEHTRNEFYRTLSIRGTNSIACWAYWEPISSHAEHARKCLKVEYLGRIEYDFQKSRVTGFWEHKDSVSAKKVKKKFHACVPLKSRVRAARPKPTSSLYFHCISFLRPFPQDLYIVQQRGIGKAISCIGKQFTASTHVCRPWKWMWYILEKKNIY